MQQSAESVTEFRDECRQRYAISKRAMAIDIAITNAAVIGVLIYLIRGTHDVSSLAWLTIPVTFLYANLLEYLLHRHVMHSRRKIFFFVFKRHTLDHHSFYTHDRIAWDRFTDARLIFFPTLMQLSFIALVVLPLVVAMRALFGFNCGNLFGITVLGYFLNYEWLHFIYHVEADSKLLAVPGAKWLRNLHQVHHQKSLMTKANFNITYPVFDLLFRTLRT